VEKAVKYSEKEMKGEVSYQSLKKALDEMKVRMPITEEFVRKIQRPERVLGELHSIGIPSEKRIRENIASLRGKVKSNRDWLMFKRKGIEKAKVLVARMTKQLGS